MEETSAWVTSRGLRADLGTRTLDSKLRSRLQAVMAVVDDHGTRGPRLLDDGMRLWRRVQKFVKMNLIPEGADLAALELACMALQLPQKISRASTPRKLARLTMRERA